MNSRPKSALAILTLFTIAASLRADKHPNTARGFDIGKPYQMNGIDNVNLFNGNLTITIPIGQRYHVNGNLSYGLTLVYSGNAWDTVDVSPDASTVTVYPNRRSNAGLGWLVSLGRLFPANKYPTQESNFWNYETPDGALHAFHAGLHDATITTPTYCAQSNAQCYTRDGTYLRMTTSASGADHTIEFPDGTSQVFREVERIDNGATWQDAPGTTVWRLREIRDRFANSVTINYSSTATNPEIWTIADGTRTQKVYFIPGISPGGVHSYYDQLVDRVVLTTFGTQTSEWKMSYAFKDMGRGGPNAKPGGPTYAPPSYAAVPLLTSFTLPLVNGASQVYSTLDAGGAPAYFVATGVNPATGGPAANPFNGVLTAMQLPTKGWLEWEYTGYAFPGSSDEAIKRTMAVKTRRMLDASHANAQTWIYDRQDSSGRACPDLNNPGQGWVDDPEQLVVSVTSPEQVTSVHYFSIFPDGATQHCPVGTIFQFTEYGLPITRGVSQTVAGTATQYLSQETYSVPPTSLATSTDNYRVSGGTRLRSEWATYDYDALWEGAPDINSREMVHVTDYEDDSGCTGGCYTAVSNANFDGAGHFRQSSTRSNFNTAPAGKFLTSFTNYNTINLTGSWLLNQFSERCKVEDSLARTAAAANCSDLASPVAGGTILSGPLMEQFCYDSNGFLTRHRKLAASAPAANDLIAVFTNTAGNVTQEDYYGGDAQTSMPESFCTGSLGSATYSIAHTYSYGSLATSQYLAHAPWPAPGFLGADNTIDPNTGLVSASRDVSEVQTLYTYDALGRLATVTPPSTEVPTTYTYAEAAAPLKVTAQRVSGSGTIQAITEFDGFGRVSREQQTLPAATTSRTSSYFGSGWLKTVSQWESSPSNFTTYTYDAFGRPKTIAAPDGSTTSIQYSGVRSTTRTVNMGTSRSGTAVSQTPTITTETYDAQGRLANLRDAAGNDTSYVYDVGGHLTAVTMGAQTRAFVYDGRGLLMSEQHPELNGAAGVISYGGFDARGHARTKFLGSSLSDFDVAYTYDAAERLRNVDKITARTPLAKQQIKVFNFDGTGGGKGKLSQDIRHNYRGNDDLVVTEDYTYRSSDGKLTDRKTTVDKNSTRLQQFTQSYDYNNIGALSTLTYPTCPDPSRRCGASTLSAVTPVFSKGMLTSIPGFANSVSYHDDGTVNQIAHPGSITDTYEADDHSMGRPKSIAFGNYDNCAVPAGVSISGVPSGAQQSPVNVQLTASASGAPTGYQWYHVVNNVAVAIPGATSAVFSETLTATAVYRVRAANGCGASNSADVTVTVSGLCTPQFSVPLHDMTVNAGDPLSLQVTIHGCSQRNFNWYQGPPGNVSGSTWLGEGDFQPQSNGDVVAAYHTLYAYQTVTIWIQVYGDTIATVFNGAAFTVRPPTPSSVSAFVSSSPPPGQSGQFQVTVNWQGPTASHFLVKRCWNNSNGCSAPVQVAGTSHSYTDTSPASGTAYLYSVSAEQNGVTSDYSGPDLATTISFTPVQYLGVVNRAHINELLTALNYVEIVAGRTQVTWSGILPGGVPAPPANGQATVGIYTAHITSLRTQMNAALSALGIPTPPYTDSLATQTPIKAIHFTELQSRVQ
ncbi:MAG: hypothetical protein QOK37_3900 [Thermoanaerobaculia bacterium]|jgi:YD repeat-containing protein|nr:hypothetical protein [Thermoanaerobaculia bacterium]